MIKTILIAIGIAVVLIAPASYAQDASLKIAGVGGSVLVKIAPSADWVDAKPGQALNPKDAIKTGENSTAMLVFSDMSTLALKPNTEIIIDDLVWNSKVKKAGLNMPAGALRAVLKKIDGPSDFKVKTPTAICGARGTVFYIIASATETRVFVTEGSIDFTNPVTNNTYVVVRDMMAISELSGTITEPRELTGDERTQALAGWTGVIAETYTEPVPQNTPAEDLTNNPDNQHATKENPATENKDQEEKPISPVQ